MTDLNPETTPSANRVAHEANGAGAPLENEPEAEPSPDGQWGGEPPNNYYPYDTSHYEPPDPNAPSHDKELDLFDHLRELRTRLLRCTGYLLPAMILTWNFTPQI